MAELTFDQLSPEEKEMAVNFYNSIGQNTGTFITEATLPPARPVDATSLDTGEPVDPPSRSWRDMAVAPLDTGEPAARRPKARGDAAISAPVDVGNDTVADVGNVYRQGDRDAGPNGDIRSAQTVLSRLGTSVGEVDGVYGKNMMNAVQEGQEILGLPRTGVLDQATQDAFNNLTDSQIDFFNSESEETANADDNFATVIKGQDSTTVAATAPLTAGFDSLTEAEGTDIHLDGRGFVTLPYGIVPDKNSIRKADGTAFNPTGSHGLRSGDLSGVDYSSATKFGISRTDYDTDEAFARAVYAEFSNKTKTAYGEGFDELSDEAKQAAYDMAWNAGTGSAGWSSVQTMLTEASKEGTKSKDSLIGFTTNFRSGKEKINGVQVDNYPRGLLKRRLQTYNLVANEGEEASTVTTSAVTENGKRTGTTYTVKASDETVLTTYTKPDTNEKLGNLSVN